MINQDNWPSRLNSLLDDAAGAIPEVGPFVEMVIDIFFPDTGGSIWEQIEKRVENLVDKKFLEDWNANCNGQVNSVRYYLQEYRDAISKNAPEIAASAINAATNKCNDLFSYITASTTIGLNTSRSRHLIPHLVVLANLDLAVRLEHLAYAKKNRWSSAAQEEIRKYGLQRYISYQYWFRLLYRDWLTWCIVSKEDSGASAKTMVRNEIGEMAGFLSGACYLHRYLPDLSSLTEGLAPFNDRLSVNDTVFIADLESVILGPYTGFDNDEYTFTSMDLFDLPDKYVDNVLIRHGDNIDGMALSHGSSYPILAGEPNGRPSYVQQHRYRNVVGVYTGWNYSRMYTIQFLFSNGQLSEQFGNDQKVDTYTSGQSGSALGYELAGASYETGQGLIRGISFFFKFKPQYPTGKERFIYIPNHIWIESKASNDQNQKLVLSVDAKGQAVLAVKNENDRAQLWEKHPIYTPNDGGVLWHYVLRHVKTEKFLKFGSEHDQLSLGKTLAEGIKFLSEPTADFLKSYAWHDFAWSDDEHRIGAYFHEDHVFNMNAFGNDYAAGTEVGLYHDQRGEDNETWQFVHLPTPPSAIKYAFRSAPVQGFRSLK